MKIGLGTAQFGLDYGITNRAGRVRSEEVPRLLDLASRHGVDVLDTAPAYGASEGVLGQAGTAAFRIVTKTPKFGAAGAAQAAGELVRTLERSLSRLRRQQVHGLLFHDPADLLGPLGDTLWSEMERLQSEGLVERIGASFYEGSEIDEALSRYPLGIVQLPFNALDARLVHGGQLTRLEQAGTEIHARSLFLQGLLLTEDLAPQFRPIAAEVERLASAATEVGLTPVEGLLALAFRRTEISRFICGATNADELEQILAAAAVAGQAVAPVYSPGPIDARMLDPRRWNELSES